jgi:splicing factor U2AF 65 kDa subunit
LKIRRPVDYDKFPAVHPTKTIPKLNVSSVGIVSTQVEDSLNKLFVGGLPHEMQEDQVKNMLTRFGKLKSFHLVKERNDKNSKGFAFWEFMNEDATLACIRELNNFMMGHRTLAVKRTGTGQDYPSGMGEEEARWVISLI